jgi:hypothetical protein
MERFKSVFSNYSPLPGVKLVNMKPTEVYDKLRSTYNQGAEYLLDNVEMFAQHDEAEDDVIYEICINPDLRRIVKWVNKKLVLQLGIIDYRTIGVRLRIATGMINKLVHEKKLSEKTGMLIHFSLVSNLNREISAINTQDLPF